MPEQDTSWHSTPGPILNSNGCREKLFHLLSIFLASKSTSELCDDQIGCTFAALRDDFESPLIASLLIESAITLRMIDDRIPKNDEIHEEIKKYVVGRLWDSPQSKKSVPLTLREACNKVIHAKVLNCVMSSKRASGNIYLRPFVCLYGEQRGKKKKEWKAKIEIEKWVDCGNKLTSTCIG
jgi:hypothetical protein